MNGTSNDDFTPEEEKLISDVLAERYRQTVETQLADIELRVDESEHELKPCPAIYWESKSCHFIIAKVEKNKFFCQFFYSDDEQFGTEKPFYDDLKACVISLLQVQADHELKKALKESA